MSGEKKLPGEGAREEKRGKRETREFHDVHDRLAEIIRTVSEVPDIEVITKLKPEEEEEMRALGQDPKDSWFFRPELDPKTREIIGGYVRIPEKIIETNLEIAQGKAAHEGSHVAITRYSQLVPDEVMQQHGFHALMAAAEERPTDHAVRMRYAGGAKWINAARRDNVRQSEEGAQEYERVSGTLPRVSKIEQLADYIVHAPHYDEPPAYFDADVLAAYEAMRADVERMENTLPPKGAAEDEIVAKAKDRYHIIYRKMWPRFRELFKQDVAEKNQREMLRRAMSDSADISEQARKMIRAMLQAGGIEMDGDPRIVELSPELVAALQQAFDELPPDDKKKIIEHSRKSLEKIEDQIVKELEGALVPHAETHEEFATRKQREKERKNKAIAERNRRDNAQKELDKLKEKLESPEEDDYQNAYQQVAAYDDQLYARLEEIFRPQQKGRKRLRSSGSKHNLPAVFRWEAARESGAPVVDNNLYEHRELPKKRDYAITFMVDLSGSMSESGKIQNAFPGIVLLTEVTSRIGLPFEVLAFQEHITPLKSFDEDLTDPVRQRIGEMLPAVTGVRKTKINFGNGGNADGPCLLDASERLKQQTARQKFLIVISDGLPSSTRNPEEWMIREALNKELHDAVTKILTDRDQHLIGLGLGKDTEHVADFYPTAIPDIPVEKLVDVLTELLEDIILHPEKY